MVGSKNRETADILESLTASLDRFGFQYVKTYAGLVYFEKIHTQEVSGYIGFAIIPERLFIRVVPCLGVSFTSLEEHVRHLGLNFMFPDGGIQISEGMTTIGELTGVNYFYHKLNYDSTKKIIGSIIEKIVLSTIEIYNLDSAT